jgi:hypothetical protein
MQANVAANAQHAKMLPVPFQRRDAVIGDGINWAWVSKKMGTRTPIQCENKWQVAAQHTYSCST